MLETHGLDSTGGLISSCDGVDVKVLDIGNTQLKDKCLKSLVQYLSKCKVKYYIIKHICFIM